MSSPVRSTSPLSQGSDCHDASDDSRPGRLFVVAPPALAALLPTEGAYWGDREVSTEENSLSCAQRVLSGREEVAQAALSLFPEEERLYTALSLSLLNSMLSGDLPTIREILELGDIFLPEHLIGLIGLAYLFDREEVASLLIAHHPSLALLAHAREGNAPECSRLLEEWRCSQAGLFTSTNLQWCFVCAALGSHEEIMEQTFYLFPSRDVTLALAGAASANNPSWVERLLDRGSRNDSNIPGAIVYALLRGNTEIVEQLLQTPLMQENHTPWSELLEIPQFLETVILRSDTAGLDQFLRGLQLYGMLSQADCQRGYAYATTLDRPEMARQLQGYLEVT